MQNAKCSMQNEGGEETFVIFHFAFLILHFAFSVLHRASAWGAT
jgi:hypothetical protein